MAPAAPSLHRRAALTGLEIFNFNLTKAYANRCDTLPQVTANDLVREPVLLEKILE